MKNFNLYSSIQKKYAFFFFGILLSTGAFAQPTINSFSPTSGPIGTSVIILGTNFNTTAANNIVFFGAVKGTVTAATSSSLTVTVPAQATFQPISVTSNGLTAYSNKPFIVTFNGGGAITGSSFAGETFISTDANYLNRLKLGDIDNDGKVDIIASTVDAASVLSIYKNNSTIGNVSFNSGVTFPTPNSFLNIATGDLDGDGKLDVALVNYNANTISILKNASSVGIISFGSEITYPCGSEPYDIAIADIDGDGKPDIVCTNEGYSSVSILKNISFAGILSFAPKVEFTTASTPRGIAVGDIDGDGKPDLVIACQYGHGISILKNTSTTGNISFASKTDFGTGANSYPQSVAIGDLDGDGKPDIAVADNDQPDGKTVSVFRNISSIGNISLATHVDLLTNIGSGTYMVKMSNIDGDGKPDILVENQSLNNTSIFRNNSSAGSMAFNIRVNFSNQIHTYDLIVGDLDGDGKPDIGVPQGGLYFIDIRRNTVDNPNITSYNPMAASTGTTVTITGTNFTGASNVSFGGTPALSFNVISNTSIQAVVGNGTSGTVSVTNAIGTGTIGGFTYTGMVNSVPTITSFSPQKGEVGSIVTITGINFNNVANSNIVYFGAAKAIISSATSSSITVAVPEGSTYEPITVTTNNLTAYSTAPFIITYPGGGNFTSGSFATGIDFNTGSSPYESSIEDVDGDGKPDIITANLSSDNFSLLRNIGSSGSLSFSPKLDFNAGVQSVSSSSGDLDGDGQRDIIIANYGSNTVSTFRNTSISGTPSFSAKIDFATGNNPYAVIVRDMNGDGKPDIVVANYGSNSFSVLSNTSSGTGTISFATKVDFSTGTQPANIQIRDFDGDGKPDVAIANYGSNSISLFRNTSVGNTVSFALKTDLISGINPNSLASADFDGDGKFEIVAANYGSNSISIFKNLSTNGNLSFATKLDYSTGANPSKIAINDLNGDGQLDIVTANVSDATVSVLENKSDGTSISFATSVEFATGNQPRSVSIADFDNDGRPDIATGNYSDNTVTILKNQMMGALPLKLLSFTSATKTNQIELYWQTDTELNVSRFSIEHSNDGLTFDDIGKKNSLNLYNSINKYNFQDHNPSQGVNYYRLKIVDIDGKFVYSKILQVEYNSSFSLIPLIVFPNPANKYIIVKHPESSSKSELRIIDLKGSIIKIQSINKSITQTEVDTKDLAPGIYQIQWLGNKEMMTKKFIVK